MSGATEYQIINKNIRDLLDTMSSKIINVVRIDSGNSLEHELKKCEIAYNLLKQGRTIITEAKLKNGKKPDILVLDLNNPIAYEIMKSESMKSIHKKEEEYLGIRIIPIKCD